MYLNRKFHKHTTNDDVGIRIADVFIPVPYDVGAVRGNRPDLFLAKASDVHPKKKTSAEYLIRYVKTKNMSEDTYGIFSSFFKHVQWETSGAVFKPATQLNEVLLNVVSNRNKKKNLLAQTVVVKMNKGDRFAVRWIDGKVTFYVFNGVNCEAISDYAAQKLGLDLHGFLPFP